MLMFRAVLLQAGATLVVAAIAGLLAGRLIVCDRGDRYLSTGVFPA